MSKLILVVDDEESIRISLQGILEDEGYQSISAENGTDALDTIHEEVPDLVLLDIWMPGMDGIQTLEKIKSLYPEISVVMMSGHGTIETAVKATRMGAFDFVEKPFSLDKVLITIANALNFKELRKENEALRLSALKEHELVGTSQQMEQIRNQIQRVAPASTPVLIIGEVGVGKELVARALHHYSVRRDKPFVVINGKSIPSKVLADELFGHDRGAYVDADQQKRGRLDLADGGTLFLNEVQELSLESQGELVRLIEEQAFERYGGSKPVRVDVRLITGSSSNLELAVQKGAFREDLYRHLQVVPLYLAPLRERRNDIPLLIRHFVNRFHRREGWIPKSFDDTAIACLKSYDWPGNVRELENIVERILIMAPGPMVTADELPDLIPGGNCHAAPADGPSEEHVPVSLHEAREQFERGYILDTMQRSGWNLDNAAEHLQLERGILQRKLVQYGVAPTT